MLTKLMQNLMRSDVGYRAPAELWPEQLHEPMHLFQRRRGQTFARLFLNKIVCNMREAVASAHGRLNSRFALREVRIDRMRHLLASSIARLASFGQTDFGIRSERQFPLHAIDSIFQPPELAASRVDLQI